MRLANLENSGSKCMVASPPLESRLLLYSLEKETPKRFPADALLFVMKAQEACQFDGL
jgi:hypothetical protein